MRFSGGGKSALQERVLEAITALLPKGADALVLINVPGDVTGFTAQVAATGDADRLLRALEEFVAEAKTGSLDLIPGHGAAPAPDPVADVPVVMPPPLAGPAEQMVDVRMADGEVRPMARADVLALLRGGLAERIFEVEPGRILTGREYADALEAGFVPEFVVLPVPAPAIEAEPEDPRTVEVRGKVEELLRSIGARPAEPAGAPLPRRSPRAALKALADDMAGIAERYPGGMFALTWEQQRFFAPAIHLLLEVAAREVTPAMTARAVEGQRQWFEAHPGKPETDEAARVWAMGSLQAALEAALGL